jgi:hypothetical protein
LRPTKPLSAQILQRAVDVNRRQTQRVGQIGLSRRKLTTVAAGQPDNLVAVIDFPEKMGQPLRGSALAETDEPFARDGPLDDAGPLQRARSLDG